MSLRLHPDVEERLTKCAEKVKMSKNALAQAAIEAAVEAIEANGGKIVLPLEFTTTHQAVEKHQAPTVTQTGPSIFTFPEDSMKVAGLDTTRTASGS